MKRYFLYAITVILTLLFSGVPAYCEAVTAPAPKSNVTTALGPSKEVTGEKKKKSKKKTKKPKKPGNKDIPGVKVIFQKVDEGVS